MVILMFFEEITVHLVLKQTIDPVSYQSGHDALIAY